MTRNAQQLLDLDGLTRGAECGVVIEHDLATSSTQVRIADGTTVRAGALRGAGEVQAGDEVLLVRAGVERWIVAGVIARETPAVRAMRTQDGVEASVARHGENGDEVLSVRDAAGRLLFEHHAAEGRTLVGVPTGDLEFNVPAGALSLRAANGVSVHTPGGISIASESTVTLSAAKPGDGSGAHIALDPVAAEISAPKVGVTAARAVVHAEDAELVARAAQSTVETLKLVAGVIETRAQRVVERAKNVYREVENLAQTRAGRIRMVARDALHASAKRTVVSGEDEAKLKGGKVYIG